MRWTWSAPDVDILFLCGRNERTPGIEYIIKRVLLECPFNAEVNSISSVGHTPPHTMGNELARIIYFLTLVTAYFEPRFFIGRGLSSAAVSELICGDSALLVDIDDKRASPCGYD